ncbi:MAG: hypothetical protein D8M58_20085 [Calditrichaeota bacterium]|nr:MAG: hypothetical protein DWQ03_14070 [Calditrichota bacterium]MBL1207710.1 hypothetical protein [Calditrichota bacterium]NOG47545.1 peptidoglycan DD-metalloendopeptidase family protein [Calditrichota bacterium]
MITVLDNSIISFLFINSIFSLIIFLLVWPLQHFLFKKNFKLRYALLALVLLRLFLPTEIIPGFNSLGWLLSSFEVEPNMTGFSIEEPAMLTGDSGSIVRENLSSNSGYNLKTIFVTSWFVGSGLFFIIFCLLRLRYKKYISGAEINSKHTILSYQKNWKRYFNISRSVKIRLTNKTTIPFTIGVFRPQIIIPESIFKNGPSVQLESVIAHEMAHIKRWDDLHIIILAFIQAVYFFNPLVWFLVKELNQLRELECDRLVLQKGNISHQKYGLSLLKTVSKQPNAVLLFILAMSDKKSKIKTRLTAIKGDLLMNKKLNFTSYFVLFVITAISISMSNPQEKPIHEKVTVEKFASSIMVKPLDFQSPLKNFKITSNYGEQRHPITKKERHHDGIDLKAPAKTEIFAAEEGQVVEAGRRGAYGKRVSILHKDGLKTMYAHLNKYFVKKGQIVKKGDVIGLVGNTGVSTGPHLHFEIREDGKPVNPKDYIKF